MHISLQTVTNHMITYKKKCTQKRKEYFLGAMLAHKPTKGILLCCECFCRYIRDESMRPELHYQLFPLFHHWWNLMCIQYATTILSISKQIRGTSESCLCLQQEWISWRSCFSIQSVIVAVDVPLFTSSDNKPPERWGHSHPTCVLFLESAESGYRKTVI